MRKWKFRFVLSFLVGVIVSSISFVLGLRFSSNETIKMTNLSTKHYELFKLAIKWIKNPEMIEDFANINKNKVIGIYGMSYLGDCLQKTLREKGVVKIYGIDKNAYKLYNPDVLIYDMKNKLPHTDIIIVTAFMYFEEIKQELEKKLGKNTNIISLEDVFYL